MARERLQKNDDYQPGFKGLPSASSKLRKPEREKLRAEIQFGGETTTNRYRISKIYSSGLSSVATAAFFRSRLCDEWDCGGWWCTLLRHSLLMVCAWKKSLQYPHYEFVQTHPRRPFLLSISLSVSFSPFQLFWRTLKKAPHRHSHVPFLGISIFSRLSVPRHWYPSSTYPLTNMCWSNQSYLPGACFNWFHIWWGRVSENELSK